MKSFMSALLLLAGIAAAQNVPVPAAGNVALPLDEYNVLVERAAHPPKPSESVPARYVLKSAEISLTVQAESVSGTVAIQGELLSTGRHKVPLVNGMIVTDAQQGGMELPLEQESGVHSALLAGPGTFAVTLATAVPLTIETGRASFYLPVPSAGAARLTLTVPGAQTLVYLSPGLITGRSSSNGRTTIEAVLLPGQTSSVWWAARLATSSAPAPPKEVRFLSDVKTLISVAEAEITVAALAEINVVQGEPTEFRMEIPAGYEVTGVTGPTLASSDTQANGVVITVNNPAERKHSFLLSLAKANSVTRAEIPLVTFAGTQRETGEVLIEGEGAMELAASEKGGLRRMDFKETNAYLRSLAGATLHAAFRYQKRPTEVPAVGLEWVRFPESQVLSAVAQQAVITTLVTSEGRSLTEVKLTVKNKAQPFLKLELPPGATILSADVAGEKVKPVEGSDGSRVPLLRPGFRPADSYEISFVFLHAGAPFAKKGDTDLTLPKMDIPIGHLQWEVFLPQRYKVADFAGNALAANLLRRSTGPDAMEFVVNNSSNLSMPGRAGFSGSAVLEGMTPGQIGGQVTDATGAAVAGATIEIRSTSDSTTYQTVTDQTGRWRIANVPAGRVSITASVSGFRNYTRLLDYDPRRVVAIDMPLEAGATSESVTVTAQASLLNTESASLSHSVTFDDVRNMPVMSVAKAPPALSSAEPSQNVLNLQQRVAGVLPIAVSVPRTGASYQFARSLVMDEETKLTFKYRRQQ
ncbi:MAG: carboxypeptidase-like regulatory domain-containing protein [Acidobacteriota bacterium]